MYHGFQAVERNNVTSMNHSVQVLGGVNEGVGVDACFSSANIPSPTTVGVRRGVVGAQDHADGFLVVGTVAVQTVEIEGVADVLLIHFAHVQVLRTRTEPLNPSHVPRGQRKRTTRTGYRRRSMCRTNSYRTSWAFYNWR